MAFNANNNSITSICGVEYGCTRYLRITIRTRDRPADNGFRIPGRCTKCSGVDRVCKSALSLRHFIDTNKMHEYRGHSNGWYKVTRWTSDSNLSVLSLITWTRLRGYCIIATVYGSGHIRMTITWWQLTGASSALTTITSVGAKPLPTERRVRNTFLTLSSWKLYK